MMPLTRFFKWKKLPYKRLHNYKLEGVQNDSMFESDVVRREQS